MNQIKKWSRNRLDPSFTTRDSYVVSKYIENPFLLAGKKFDLRLYVLLASWRPLIVYKYAQGFARFCSVQYSTDTSELDNNFMHLTNVSIQSKGEDYNDDHGGKWSFTNLLNFIAGTRGKAAVDKLKKDIDNVLSISIRSVASMMTHEKNCFELYGFDLLVDSGLQPWLIEVNASPSLSATTAADKNLKHDLINDMLNIIVPSSFPDVQTRAFPKNRKEMGGFEILIE